jgi:hypothetical protein
MLVIALRKSVGALGIRRQLGDLVKIVIATAAMGAFVVIGMRLTAITSGSYSQCLLWTVVIAGLAVILYGVLLLLLRVKTVWSIVQKLRNHFKAAE